MPEPSLEGKRRKFSPMVVAGVILALAAVVAIVAGVALAQRRDVKAPGSGTAHAGSGEGSAAVGGPPQATGATQAVSSPGSPGSTPATGEPPAGKNAAPRPDAPARAGGTVPTLTAPPESTIGMLVVPADFKTATYRIVFRPYGWGPGGAQGGRLVVRIDSSVAADAAAKAFDKDFAGRNAVVWVQGPAAQNIKFGGSYSGEMLVRRTQGDVGVLYLRDVSGPK